LLKYLQETSPVAKAFPCRKQKKKKNPCEEIHFIKGPQENSFFVTLHGFLIIFHNLMKSFNLNLQPAGVLLEAKAVMTFLTA